MDRGLCFGPKMVQATYVVQWLCLAWFFLCVNTTLAVILDLNGVPQKYLFHHLEHKYVRLVYLIPEVSMMMGILFLALGFAMDIGERAGCVFFYGGCIGVIVFVSSVALAFWFLKLARTQSRDKYIGENEYIGKHVFATWRDRIDYMSGENADDTRRKSSVSTTIDTIAE